MESFKDRLKELREAEGISMAQLGNALGVSSAAVCKWENSNAEPKVSYLIALSEFFDCSVDYLVGKTDDYRANKTVQLSPRKLNAKEKQLVDCYRRLDPNLKALLLETVKTWIDVSDSE